MPILRLHAENIGPFDKLELDLTDGKGKAHLGPHILAGVNGSGKTTVLRTIARCLAKGVFDQSWRDYLRGRNTSRALLEVKGAQQRPDGIEFPYWSISTSMDTSAHMLEAQRWAAMVSGAPVHGGGASVHDGQTAAGSPATVTVSSLGCIAAYAPKPTLRRLDRPPANATPSVANKALAFGETVSNDDVQAYWANAFSREALARTTGEGGAQAFPAVQNLRRAIENVLGDDCVPSVSIMEPFVQPVLKFRGTELNFSQLAAGLNATLGWVVDYLLRQEYFAWPEPRMAAERPGLILIDEIETHLHPQWQRRVLNGIRAAFPNAQIVVTTHSPFVISSCPGARLHLFDLDEQGKARVVESTDAPVGASFSANIRGVFGIGSEFGPEIEDLLKEWNNLKKHAAVAPLPPQDRVRLKELQDTLTGKGEEVASIVADPPVLPPEVIAQLAEAAAKHR